MKAAATNQKKLHMAMLALFMVVLLLPWLQELTGIFPERELVGVEEQSEEVPLSFSAWTDQTFQKDFEKRHYAWMGLRAPLVRMENQLDHSLFGRLYDKTLVGETGELFRRSSYDAYTGRDFVGDKQVNYHANHVAYMQQYLLQKNIRLFPVFTPSKLRCMPEEAGNYDLEKVGKTNYKAYLTAFNSYKTAYLDLTGTLTKATKEGQHRIFPKTGSHWTDYGATVGFKALLAQMERQTGLDYADFSIDGFETSTEMRGTDADAGDILNLVADFPVDAIDYPMLSFQNGYPKQRPKVLVIGDSFWWKIYDQGLHKEVFAPGAQFRYYNWEVFSDGWEGARIINEFDLVKSVEEVDWIILCANEGNFHKFPFGFAEQLLEAYGLQN